MLTRRSPTHSKTGAMENNLPSSRRPSPAKAKTNGSVPTNMSLSKLLYIILSISAMAAALLFLDNQQRYYLKSSLRKGAAMSDAVDVTLSMEEEENKNIVRLRKPEIDKGEETLFDAEVVDELEGTTGT